MARYIITGGRQRTRSFRSDQEWSAFDLAIALEYDDETRTARPALEYESPAPHRPDVDPCFIFKSGSRDGEDGLLLCTQTEIISYHLPTRTIRNIWSHPWFNDVHHVARIDGRIHVVSTGLDAVLVLDDDGDVTEVHSVIGGTPWDRFDPKVDYRKIPTTRPHKSHPNYVFKYDGEAWVTRFEQRDALALGSGRRLALPARAAIHDGVLDDAGTLWFTSVSGELFCVHAGETRAVSLGSLAPPDDPNAALGWCRGVAVESNRVLVGFSRFRPTLLSQNLSWLRTKKSEQARATRVDVMDRATLRVRESWNLEQYGLNAIFSILRLPQ